jgi:predicted nucleic acid-binding protein
LPSATTAEKRKLDLALLLAAFQVMPIDWRPASEYEDHRAEAERRIASRDPDDWPTLTVALKLRVPIWSQDKDFSDTGVEIVTTGTLLDATRADDHPEG